jgi:ribosomal protein S18 acetylase RimI-like enzyme
VTALEIRAEPADSPKAIACLRAYFAELGARFRGGFNPESKGFAVGPDTDDFYLARRLGRVVGCGAVRMLEPGVFEIKRMWVLPEARGTGVGKALLGALEHRVAALGAKRIVLDTNKSLTEARALYLGAGYREIARYSDNPYADFWFEKILSARSPPRSCRACR